MAEEELLHAEVAGNLVRLSGEIDLTTSGLLRAALRRAAEVGDEVVVDMSAVTFVGSVGIREFGELLRDCHHVRLVLEHPSDQLKRVLQVVPTERILPRTVLRP